MEYLAALWFYIVFSLFGLVGLPIAHRLLPSRTLGIVAAKPIGLILVGYVVWLLATLHILDYQNIIAVTTLAVVAMVAGVWYGRGFFVDEPVVDTKKKKKVRKNISVWKKILIVEGVTLLAYFAYLWLRSHNAGVNGTERFMDMMLLTASGHTNHFPFIDSWYAGKTVNYYYYGSYLMSLISNIAHIPYTLSYTFSLGLVYCQSALLSAGLVFHLTRSRSMAMIGAFLVTTAGTIFFAVATILSSFTGVVYTYASSTRLYTPSYIINEIPSYSFTVGDLHAHLLALPFFLLALILIYAFAHSDKVRVSLVALIALSLATSGMINVWDLVTLASLVGLVALGKALTVKHGSRLRLLFVGAGIVVAALCLMIPDLIFFKSPVLGIGLAPAYAAAHNLLLNGMQYPTPLLAELGMWGVFVLGSVWVIVAYRREWHTHLFLIAAGVVSIGIIVGVELLFIKDIYSVTNPPYFRANTTFKFGYHAWTMLAIIFATLMAIMMRKKGVARGLAVTLTSTALLAGLFYPYQAIKQFYAPNNDPVALDGVAWMKNHSAEDLATIRYINEHFTDRAVIAEAVGDSYSWYGRIVTFTGQITPMGWKSHEWTWRFDGHAAASVPFGTPVETGWGPVSIVASDIQTLYETPDVNVARGIIEKYGIQYIYIGAMERTAYPMIQEAKFATLGIVEFQMNNSMLFKMR